MSLAMVTALAACQSATATQLNPNAMPKSPTDLPAARADLTLSGSVSGHVTEVRIFRCRSSSESGKPFFNGDVFFEVDRQWYFLELTGEVELPQTTTYSRGYFGPGRYKGTVFLRAMDLYPGGLVTRTGWSNPTDRIPTMIVGPSAGTVTVGSASTVNDKPENFADVLEFWPVEPGVMGPAPFPTPEPDQVIRLTGSWTC
jgi:hypothetical protein